MKVVWKDRGNSASAIVGDYGLYAGLGSLAGQGYVYTVRAGQSPVLSGDGEDSLEDAMKEATARLYERMVELYGDILEREDPTA